MGDYRWCFLISFRSTLIVTTCWRLAVNAKQSLSHGFIIFSLLITIIYIKVVVKVVFLDFFVVFCGCCATEEIGSHGHMVVQEKMRKKKKKNIKTI